jgi:hypothetical protein
MDFFFRKIVRDHGQALAHVAAQVTATVDSCDASLKQQAEQLRRALEDVQAMTGTLTGYLMSASESPTEIYKVGLASVRYLLAVGDLLIGWRLLVQANVATAALAAGKDDDFYRGKVAAAAFFAANVLPELAAVRSIIEEIDDDVMQLSESAF